MIKDFKYYLRIERGLSPNTVAGYGHDVEEFLKAVDKKPSEISSRDIADYLGKTGADGLSKRSTARLLSSLRSFFDWCIQEGEVKENPCDRVDAPKLGKYLPAVLSLQEVEAILESVDLKAPYGKRNRAILEVLYGCGLRVSEAATLRVSHVYLDEGFVNVIGKGNKQRKVYFDARTKIHLQRYLAERTDTCEALFVSLLKPYGRLQISGVEIRLRKIGRELNFQKVHPHKFRRTLATMAIDKGMPIEQLQQLLGHRRIDTTLQYAMVKQSNVKTAHRKYIG